MTKKKRGLPKQAAFLAAYTRCAQVTEAAKAAQMDRALHYRWLKEDDAYAAAFQSAEEQAAQSLEDEAVRRATEGVDEPIVYKGQFVYKQRPVKNAAGKAVIRDGKPLLENYGKPLCINRKADGLLMFLLRGFRPEKYRDRTEVSGPGGGPVRIERIERVIVDPKNPDP